MYNVSGKKVSCKHFARMTANLYRIRYNFCSHKVIYIFYLTIRFS